MRSPKPPTPGSVSATLRYASFRALGNGDEGYEVMWHSNNSNPAAGVRVSFHAAVPDWPTGEQFDQAAAVRATALTAMGDTLRRKGWQVEDRGTFLVVRGQLEVARG